MAAKYPEELQDALIARNGAQAAMDRSLTQSKKRMNKSKNDVGLSIEHEEAQVAVTYYLLLPQEAELEPAPLHLGESIIVFSQKEWKMVMITSKYKEGEREDMWGNQRTSIRCLRIKVRQ